MNSEQILFWLVEEADKYADDCYPGIWQYKLEDLLFELNTRRNVDLPQYFSAKNKLNEDKAITELKKTFGNKISLITLALSYFYPEKYSFYRPSTLENDIFAGFKFLSDAYDYFQFPFSKIGQNKR